MPYTAPSIPDLYFNSVTVPGGTTAALWIAAACWISAFGLFVWLYAPLLSQPRPDGHPG